jgi:hypothetical protein
MLCTMKRRSPMQSACALLKRRSRCRSPKLLRSHWRKRQSQTHRAPLSWSHRWKKSCWRKRRSHLPPPPCRGLIARLRCHSLRGRSPTGAPCRGPTRGRGGPIPPPVVVPREGRECLVSVDDNSRVLLFFFSQKHSRFFSPFFS